MKVQYTHNYSYSPAYSGIIPLHVTISIEYQLRILVFNPAPPRYIPMWANESIISS